jgi:hypothetical protein
VLTVARIRTIKPEAFTSESLAEVSLTAERTFFGLLTQADDQGRFRDNPAIIAGLLWPLRAEHTPVHVEEDLEQLARAGLICRYTGCDGRRYLHIVTWAEHQKIDRPSLSRLPSCTEHHPEHRCGACKGTCTAVSAASREAAPSARGGDAEASVAPSRRERIPSPRAAADTPVEGSPRPRRTLGEAAASGSRTVDRGSGTPAGRAAPASARSARALIAAYIAGCATRPPDKVLGHLGREVNQMLTEGIAPEFIRVGLERFRRRPMHPSVLPSLVNEAMNTGHLEGKCPSCAKVPPPMRPGRHDVADYSEEL